MDRILNGGRALDLGCGAGRESLFLAQHGYEVEAVDKDSAHVEQLDARARGGNLPLKALNLKIEKFEILPHNYSLIIARHSLSFIPDLPTVMSVIKNMVGGLKSEGMVCFTLFGNRDGWTGRADMSFFEYEPVIALLKSLPLCLY